MKVLTWQGERDVRVEDVPDPPFHDPTDAAIKITRRNIRGSDSHAYEIFQEKQDGSIKVVLHR